MRSSLNLSRGGYALLAIAVLAFVVAARASDGVARASSPAGMTVHVGNANNKSNKCSESDYTHVFVTIDDIQGHQSGKGVVAGWHDLTTNLGATKSAQIDLLDAGPEASETPSGKPTDCVLAEVGSSDNGIPPGNYQQFRMQLVPNGGSPAPSPNACATISATTYNCVEVKGQFAALTVPSNTVKTSGHGVNVKPGQGVDLDIDVDACRDIVAKPATSASPSPSYSLKPVMHAGALTLGALIAGDTVVGSVVNGNVTPAASPVAVPSAAVWLEQTKSPLEFTVGDPTPAATASIAVEDVVAETTSDQNGHFVFCPVPNGSYEIVAEANTGSPSDVTITKQVKVTSGPNNLVIPLLPASAVTLSTEFTDAGPSGAATPPAATIEFGAVQSSATGPTVQIPLLSGTAANPVTTSLAGCASVPTTCPNGTDCACFAINVPSDNPVIGPQGGPYAAPSGTAEYNVFGQTSQQTIKCTPPDMITPFRSAPMPTPTLSFVSCH